MQSQNGRMISILFHGKQFNSMVIQVYALSCNAEEAEFEWFYEDHGIWSHHFMGNRWGNSGNSVTFLGGRGAPKSLQMVTAAMN